MPAESEKQRRFMALVNAVQSKKVSKSKVSGKVKDAAKSMTKEQSHDFMQKKASEDFFSGRKPVDPSRYSVVRMRRQPDPEEQAMLEEEASKLFPDLFQNPGEVMAQDMSSPLKGALLYGSLAGAGAGYAGKKLGELIQEKGLDKKIGTTIDPKDLAIYGGATTAALAAMLAYFNRWKKNKIIEDETLRLPKGATRRDRDWSPAINMEKDPEAYVKRVAALNSAMMGRLSPKELEAFL